MKKLLTVVILSLVLLFSLTGCDNLTGGKTGDINVYMPDGAPALAMAYMMDSQKEIEGSKLNYNVVPAETIAAYVRNEKADMVVIPANAAVALYNQGAKYKIAAVVTHGNLFIVGKQADSFKDFEGKVLGTFGNGQIPDLVLKSLLKMNGIDFEENDRPVEGKVALLYANSAAEVRDLIIAEKVDFGFLAEPVATGTVAALKDSHGISQLFDVQMQWKEAMEELGKDYADGYPQAVLLVKDGLDKQIVDKFLAECKEGDGWAETHAAEAVAAIKANAISGTTSVMPNVSGPIIAKCNIKTYTTGLSEYVGDFLSITKQYVASSQLPKDSSVYY